MNNKGVKRPSVSFIGNSATEVTGSAYLIKFKKYEILLDCGLIQGQGDIVSNYKANREQALKIKPKTIDYILVSHQNIDHIGLLPSLYSRGCHAHIYCVEGLSPFIRVLLEDSLKVMQSDCLKIEKKKGRKAPPLYTQEDIEKTMSRIIEVPYNQEYSPNDSFFFKFIGAGHIIHAASIFLTLKEGSILKKIYYSGDIGGLRPQMYVEPRQTPDRFNLGIVETTYCQKARMSNSKNRVKDLEKICSIVEDYKKILFPAFALNRSQVIITELYKLWKDGKIPHDIPVYFDSPLGQRISNLFDDELWLEVQQWSNLKPIKEYADSQAIQARDEKCIVIASAGMCNAGRIVSWLKSSLASPSTHIVFIGYCPDTGTAADIKSTNKEVKIDGELVGNNANYTELHSFSSHADYNELLDFYNSLEYDKLALVHGEFSDKVTFANVLQEKLSSQGKSSKVVAVNADQKIYL